jgi:hypothetical protein
VLDGQDCSAVPGADSTIVNSYNFQPDVSKWTADCQRYRLTFNAACDQPSGDTFWMRYRLSYGVPVASPCGTLAYGEVEDISGQDTSIFTDPLCYAQTPVTLESFTGTAVGESIELAWTTGTESQTAGFNVWRAGSDGNYAKVNGTLIASQGGPVSGADYAYTDDDVAVRTTYSYKLEIVDLNGSSSYSDPITVKSAGPVLGCGVAESGRGTGLGLLLLVVGAVLVKARKATRKGYRKPEVKTTSTDELVRKIGPAQTCSGSPTCPSHH